MDLERLSPINRDEEETRSTTKMNRENESRKGFVESQHHSSYRRQHAIYSKNQKISFRSNSLLALFLILYTLYLSSSNREGGGVNGQDNLFQCPKGWSLRGLYCYQFFNIHHSWHKASQLCKRYGSDLASVQSFRENNFTSDLASQFLFDMQSSSVGENVISDDAPQAYWLGLQAYNQLQTNTLEADAGHQISQYYGHWGAGQPRVNDGECVKSVLSGDGRSQSWELTTCEELLPFMCAVEACPSGTFHCSNGGKVSSGNGGSRTGKTCVNNRFVCDGQDDCGDESDELNCPDQCRFHLVSSGDIIQSPHYPGKYQPFSNCRWILEGPRGSNIILQFSEFDTERHFDTVQILGGGRTEETAINIDTLSGSGELSNTFTSKTYVSASNFMIIKFKTDGSVEKRGFRASWRTEMHNCGGQLSATTTPQYLTSPNYPLEYPGGLECLHIMTAPSDQIITLEVEDLDLEPERDFLLIRDGDKSTDNILTRLTGSNGINEDRTPSKPVMSEDRPRFIFSTSNKLYVYMRSDQADSRKGFKIKYHQGCHATFHAHNGTVMSPAFGITKYPHNQECIYRIRHPTHGRLSMKFESLDLHDSDNVKVFDGEGGLRLHPGDGFTGSDLPPFMLSAESGEMIVHFSSDSLQNGKGFKSVFSADCEALSPGKGAMSSSIDTVFGSEVKFTCPTGFVFATGVSEIFTQCMPGGKWSQPYIPKCQEVYCGPVPQIDNGFAIAASNVSLNGKASYQCYAGFNFPSGQPLETIVCTKDGTWSYVPICQASQCPPLDEVEHVTATVLAGRGLNYGTVIRYECDSGYERSGRPVLVCQSNGTWSSALPSCSRVRCHDFPQIENGYVVDKTRRYFYGDQALVDCHRGYNRIGSNIITCGDEQTFENLPKCEDKNECDAFQCDFKSTECTNMAGSYHCKCRDGFNPNLECRPVVDLGLSDGGISDEGIIASGYEPNYPKELVRLNSPTGWCGSSSITGTNTGNWIVIDLKAPTIVRGFRTQGVRRLDGTLAFPTAIRLMYTNDLSDVMNEFRNVDSSPVEFRVLDGDSMSVMNLPTPIEARYLRLNVLNYTSSPCMRLELMGCQKQSCNDVNECLRNNAGCDQKCINNPGSFNCMCNIGFELFTKDGTSNFYIPDGETGLRDGDLYRLNKTCVPKMCPPLKGPNNGRILSMLDTYRFGNEMKFGCDFGYVLVGDDSLTCTSSGEWSGQMPTCRFASCTAYQGISGEGLKVGVVGGNGLTPNLIPFGQNETFTCEKDGYELRRTSTSAFRQCVFDPKPQGGSPYWMSGLEPHCTMVDCGVPPVISGADYGDIVSTKYQSSFFFGCKDEAFRLVGQSSKNDNIVRCQSNGVWDFGDMRCEGPVCEDPMRPPDGVQISSSFEQGSKVKFDCSRKGYIPINPTPIECTEQPECKVISALGITSGKIPDSSINATSERGNYEAKNIRLNSVTGWCGKKEAFTYVNIDLGSQHRIKSILVKGVITDDVVGRPTEIRFFYKEREQDNYVVYSPNFNLTARDPGNYGELAMITLPLSVKARFVILGIVSFNENPCLKFELMGCEIDPTEPIHLGFDNGYPMCVDNEPPAFVNCPSYPIEVQKGQRGYLPVNFSTPVAVDNSGSIARMEVVSITQAGRSEGFLMPMNTFEDMMVEYYAFDFDGNVAICQVNISVKDDVPPSLECPQSFVIALVEESDSYNIDLRQLRSQVNASDPNGDVVVTFIPERATIPIDSYENVTVVAVDEAGNLARCFFQVAIKATPCVEWELKPPAHGKIQCSEKGGGLNCEAVCNAGYRFTDGEEKKELSCEENSPWTPSKVIPDCVSEDTTLSTYDVAATITYRGNGAVPDYCPSIYAANTSPYLKSLSLVLTDRCAAGSGGMDINVAVKPLIVEKKTGMNIVEITYTMMVTPALPQPRIYDLCGQTHDLIFDLSIQRTNELIKDFLEIRGDSEACPTLRALRSDVRRGFVCQTGEVLNKIRTGDVPRCLECPAGFYGAKGEEECTQCPKGMYQDEVRQGKCKVCPPDTWTLAAGTKTINDCIPVCGHGSYSPSGLVPCLECPRNSFTGEPPFDGFKECTACPKEEFTFQPGAQRKNECREKCAPGTYSETGLAPCAPCPLHFFQPLSGQTQCFECHTTEETLGLGSVSKDQCKDVKCPEGSCEYGGLCVPSNHHSKCFCPAGFRGARCEIDVDECASSPCYNGGTCVDQPQGYRCDCTEGYSGRQCIIEKSPCDSNPCPSRAMCKSDPHSPSGANYTCMCRSGYTGENCDVTVDPCRDGESPCQNDGQCNSFQQGRYVCECEPGWYGVHCEINVNDCSEQPCLLGAKCKDLVNDFECECPKGFGGKRCQTKIDLCAVAPGQDPICANGKCIDKIFDSECLCEPGWTGLRCDINLDECFNPSNPCKNEGQCIDGVNDYSCLCDPAFTGKQCQHEINHCANQPCQNGGTCTNDGETFYCDCRPGFVGLTCEAAIDECATNVCDPTGTARCVDMDNKFVCECRDGFVGIHCETNVDDCASSPCMNQATCIDNMGGYECICPSGWTGDRCETDVSHCESSPCDNDAECVDLFEDYFCVCPKGTDGKKCETAPERCIGSPCLNNGLCQDFGSGLNCSCPSDYTGIGCEYEYDACADDVCMNGATCIDDGPSFQCLCPNGFKGRYCEENVDDCSAGNSCPPAAQCIDLVDETYCRCPFNLTGEDCRKTIQVDYDLHFIDDTKSSSASLVVPFVLGSPSQLTVGMWVQFDTPGETGTYFTLFAVDSEYHSTNKRVIMQAVNSGVYVNFFPGLVNSVFLQFPAYVPIANGRWHHIAVTWVQETGTLTLVSDGLIADKRERYGASGLNLPKYSFITLGSSAESPDGRTRTESGFQGKLTRVQVWNRALDPASDIPLQVRSCRAASVIFDGLILRWSGYDRTMGGVERIMPSVCGSISCEPGFSGQNCEIVEIDKIPPKIEYCPPTDIWVSSTNGSAVVRWNEPVFTDNIHIEKVINKGGIKPGQALQWGTYDVAYVAYDSAGNTEQCTFKIYVLESFCPPLDPPQGGSQSCEDWGPSGRFKVCRIECNDGLRFSQRVSEFYTCGAEGFWRPQPNPDDSLAPFTYPACSKAAPAQKIYKLKLDFLTDVLCNDAGKGVLKERIIAALQQLNKEWNFSTCNNLSEKECDNLGINVNCNRRSSSGGLDDSKSVNNLLQRIKRDSQTNDIQREARQLNNLQSSSSSAKGNDDQAYQLEISFPTTDDEATNTLGRTERIERLLESIILEQNQLNVNDTLPNVRLDKSSLSIEKEFTCTPGEVVIGNECVRCPEGTFHDVNSRQCEPCPLGHYNSQVGQLQCQQCPSIKGQQGVTQVVGANHVNMCKERCPIGQFFDQVIDMCRPCGYGKYQSKAGQFQCELCGLGQTTRNKEATSADACRDECPDGKQLGDSPNSDDCVPCPLGTFRTKGLHLACEPCPAEFTTRRQASTRGEDCSVPVCPVGSYLNATFNSCDECPRGRYQDTPQQTFCIECPQDTSTAAKGAKSKEDCTNRCHVGSDGEEALCDKNANCLFLADTNDFICKCKPGYRGTGVVGDCADRCLNFCRNEGQCLKDKQGEPYCQCAGSFTGKRCGTKSTFAYIAGGIAGSVVFIIVLVLLIWMICVRANRTKRSPEKILGGSADQNGSQVNFYYGAPAPYAESIAPSHHSTYAHYYDDEEDGWEMPNFYNESYMKDGLHAGNKMNSLARSNASLYGGGGGVAAPTPGGMKPQDNDLYDRLRRHTYMGKKSDKGGNETTSDSDGQ